MWQWFTSTLQKYPEIAIFMTLALGYYFGKFTFKGIGLGSVTATLLAGVLIGQIGISISGPLKATVFLLFLFAASFLPAQQPLEIPFDSVPDFLKLPSDLYFGEVAGVALNSKGHVFVFSRGNSTGPAYAAAAAQLLEFESNGKFLREIGHNVYAWSYAHAVKVDKNDNIWVADKGSDLVMTGIRNCGAII